MRRALSTAVLLLATSTFAGDLGGGFALPLPPGIADVTGWDAVAGQIDSANVRGQFLFYVNPHFGAIYQVMRYRVDLLVPATELEKSRAATERVVYVRHPGVREPLLCWAAAPSDAAPVWREIAAGTDEYRLEMATLIRVLALHREALAVPQP